MPTYAQLSLDAAQSPERLRVRIRARSKVDDNGCWIWPLGLQPNGYGRITVDKRRRLAHRISYEAFRGAIPDGRDIDHLCRVRNCVNPAHLEVVTHRENMLRGDTFAARNAAATHCAQGHPFDEANTYRRPGSGSRDCKKCKLAANARWAARQRERRAA